MFLSFCKHYPRLGVFLFSLIVTFSILVSKSFAFHIPPLLLATLRIGFVFPLILLVSRPPQDPLFKHLLRGLLFALGYYGCLYTALSMGAMPGLSMLFSQMNIPLGVVMAALYLKLYPSKGELWGVGIIVCGAIGLFCSQEFHRESHLNPYAFGFLSLAIFAQTMWMLFYKKNVQTHHLNHMVWQCALATPVLALLSYSYEGSAMIMQTLSHLSAVQWVGLAVLCFVGTLLSSVFLVSLLQFHKPATIFPLTGMIPCLVMICSYFWFQETFNTLQILSAGVIMLGVYVAQRYKYGAVKQNEQ